MFSEPDLAAASRLLQRMRAAGVMLATAESCTGGLIAALLTEIPGSSDVLERGFVTYSNRAKCELLGVPMALIDRRGAVSAEVAVAMAAGAVAASAADIALSVTGIAGPGGGTAEKPVGLVHIAALRRGGQPIGRELRLGGIGRSAIRLQTVREALGLADQLLDSAV